jgi:hypothetical protein
METWERVFEYHDKMELKKDYAKGIRVVQEHLLVLTFQSGVIMMPGYVNIGAM